MPSFVNDLLQEVARVMYEPARADTEDGKRVRFTAKELLRKYGQAGTNAFRAVQHSGNNASLYSGQDLYSGVGGGAAPPLGPPPGGYPGALYGSGPTTGYPIDNGGLTGARAQLQDEVKQLIDKSKSNAELLSDMLLNSSANTSSDDFESDLIKDLTTQCRELREILNGYLEKLAVQPGEAMERLLAQTLEAADSLDCALSLQKDIHLGLAAERAVNVNVGHVTPPPPPPPAQQAGAAAASSYPSLPPAAPPPPAANNDLIALDDLFGSIAVQQPPQHYGSPAPAYAAPAYGTTADPFAAYGAPPQPYGSPAPAPPPPPYYAPPSAPAPGSAPGFPPSPPKPTAMADPFAGIAPIPVNTYTPPPPMIPPQTTAHSGYASAFPEQPAFGAPAPAKDPFATTGTFNSVPYSNPAFDLAPSGGVPSYSAPTLPQPQQPALSANNPFAASSHYVPQQQSNPFVAQSQVPYAPQQPPAAAAAVDQEWAAFFSQPRQ